MKRNILKIVFDPLNNRISYYFKNEIGQWCSLSNSSILSRQAYTKTTIKDSADEIIKIADEIYNRKNIYNEVSDVSYLYRWREAVLMTWWS